MTEAHPILEYRYRPNLISFFPPLFTGLFYYFGGMKFNDQVATILGGVILILLIVGLISYFYPGKVVLGPDYIIIPSGLLRSRRLSFHKIKNYKFKGQRLRRTLQFNTSAWFFLIPAMNFQDLRQWEQFESEFEKRVPATTTPERRLPSPLFLKLLIIIAVVILGGWLYGIFDTKVLGPTIFFIVLFVAIAFFSRK